MLTGYTPFDADTPLAILMKHLNDPLPLPSKMDPSLPAVLEPIVLKALAKEPADRYQSAAEMSAALQRAADSGMPTTVRVALPPPGSAGQAVFSGAAREKLVDKDFAEADTDFDIATTLPPAADASTPPPAASAAPVMLSSLEKLSERFAPSPPQAALVSLGVIILANFFVAMFLVYTRINGFAYGWPFELFCIAGFLASIGWSLRNPWLLTPGTLIAGNAFLMMYCSITGRWGDWFFLWMLEPFIVAGAVLLPHSLMQSNNRARAGLACMAFIVLMVALASASVGFGMLVSFLRIITNAF
jgi:serine/threonine protein kinase